jgi:trehalose 6-phosphate phosphatase
MTDILAKKNQRVLARYALSNLLVAFDYDGTLAPIVAVPERARMRPTTRRLLRRVAERYPCVVISGRARADLIPRLKGVPVVHISGNHGLEPWAEDVRYVVQVREWAERLRLRLGGCQGIVIEDKTYSLSIHFRAARHKRDALRGIEAAIADLRGARRIGGKLVVNLVPEGAPTKGVALERARRLLMCDAALYVGDDETDEEVFGAMRADRLLSVRVGATADSRASFRLKHQGQIDGLLRQLVALRPRRAIDSLERRCGVRLQADELM